MKVTGKKVIKNNDKNNITIDSFSEPIFNDNMEISIGYGATLNIGNYETLRVDIKISQKCDSKNREKIFKELKKDVMLKIKQECIELRKAGVYKMIIYYSPMELYSKCCGAKVVSNNYYCFCSCCLKLVPTV